MNKPVEIKEFDSIIYNKDYAYVDNYTCIAEKDFQDMKTFIEEYAGTEENADALDFMRIVFKRGVGYMVTFKSYVGLIQMKNGFQIQVLPKIDFGTEATTKTLWHKVSGSISLPSPGFFSPFLHSTGSLSVIS